MSGRAWLLLRGRLSLPWERNETAIVSAKFVLVYVRLRDTGEFYFANTALH